MPSIIVKGRLGRETSICVSRKQKTQFKVLGLGDFSNGLYLMSDEICHSTGIVWKTALLCEQGNLPRW